MRDSYILYQDKLQGEYQKTFEQIAVYFVAQQVDDDTREEYMGDLLDIFLLAQEEGKPVEKITGKNLESFCKSFCSNLTWKQRALRMLDQLKSYAWMVFLFSLLEISFSWDVLISGEISFFEVIYETNMFGYLLGIGTIIVFSAITGYMTKMLMFRMKKVSIQAWKAVVAIVVIASSFIFIVLYFDERTIEFSVGFVWMISGIYLVLYYILNRKRLSVRKEHKVSFWAEVKKGIEFDPNTDNTFLQEMEKKWEKKNKKRQKKGLPELTRAEILEAEEEENIKAERNQWVIWLFPLIITFVSVMLSEFETTAGFLWFTGISLIIEYLLIAFFMKAAYLGIINSRKWIAYEREKLVQMEVDQEV